MPSIPLPLFPVLGWQGNLKDLHALGHLGVFCPVQILACLRRLQA